MPLGRASRSFHRKHREAINQAKRGKKPVQMKETLETAMSVTVRTSHTDLSPSAQIAKWQEVLKTLGKRGEVSPQEQLAREVIRKRIKELKEAI